MSVRIYDIGFQCKLISGWKGKEVGGGGGVREGPRA